MSENNNPGAPQAPVNPSLPAAVQPAPQATAAQPAAIQIPSDVFKARLDETRAAERSALLKELGYDSLDAAKTASKLANDLRASQMTEAEKTNAELTRLRQIETQATALKTQYDAYAAREFSALPESAQKAIDAQAGGDAVKRMQLIELGRAAGWIGGQLSSPPAPPPAPAPANTGPTAQAPNPSPVSTTHDKWKQLQATDKSGFLADLFYRNNSAEIERTRPQGH